MAKKKSSKQLTAEEIQEFKKLLLSKRAEIVGDVSSIENETLYKTRSDLSNMPIHMADVGTDNYEQEFTLELLDGERKVLAEIEAALKRIEEGAYGICEGTGKVIERQRLEAIPWAKYSVDYANRKEKDVERKNNYTIKGIPSFPVGDDNEGVDDLDSGADDKD